MTADAGGARFGVADPERVERVMQAALERHPDRTGRLLGVLEDVQEACRFIPGEAIERIAAEMDVPAEQIVTMCEFFSYLSLDPVGHVVIDVCDGTACHLQGAPRLVAEMEKHLGLKVGQTSDDGAVTLRVVGCVGACGLAPVVVMDDATYGRVRVTQIADLAALAKKRGLEALEREGEASVLPVAGEAAARGSRTPATAEGGSHVR